MVDVKVPMLQRPIFWVGIAILTSVAGLLAGRAFQKHRMRRCLAEVERMHALERERARIARDLHDNLGSGLTEIAMKSDLVCYEAKQFLPPESYRHLERICQSATELTRSVDEIVWAVNPANDSLRHFVNYLTQSTEQFLSASKLRLSLDIPSDLPDVELVGKKRHTIFLAVREALNNAVKHSQASRLKLQLRWEHPSLSIVVEDNGSGFVPPSSPTGIHEGLAGMRRRLDEIGGRFELTSQPGAGTQVKLTVRLADNSK